jgi:hypothetical protein
MLIRLAGPPAGQPDQLASGQPTGLSVVLPAEREIT